MEQTWDSKLKSLDFVLRVGGYLRFLRRGPESSKQHLSVEVAKQGGVEENKDSSRGNSSESMAIGQVCGDEGLRLSL